MGNTNELKNGLKESGCMQIQLNNDWNQVSSLIANYIKLDCMRKEACGEKTLTTDLDDYVQRIEKEYTEQNRTSMTSDAFMMKFEDSEYGRMWSRMRNHFYHYICEEMQKPEVAFPNVMGMSEKEVRELAVVIEGKLKQEGFTAKITLREAYFKIHYEPEGASLEEQMYSLGVEVMW